MGEAQEGERGLVVARGDAAPVLEFVEQAFDQVALAIGLAIIGDGSATAGGGGNDGIDAMEQQLLADRVCIVALVGNQRFDFGLDEPEEREEGLPVMGFATGEDEAERPAFAVAAGVNLGGEAAARTAQSLRVLIPPFAPAAW